ncbi:hypothetical protein IQ64_37490 [Streptomyces stelliscabiei]|nr:hypothetical protein IQ64_37490 [Streptomyces stelliscabiei]
MTIALIGSPRTPPTPSVALIRAIEVSRRRAGTVSRRMAILTGMMPVVAPCSPRPRTSIHSSCAPANTTTEPRASSARSASTTRRLPIMPASRPEIGVRTAATRSVAVTAHAVSSRPDAKRSSRCAWMGVIAVKANDDPRPATASKATTLPGCG